MLYRFAAAVLLSVLTAACAIGAGDQPALSLDPLPSPRPSNLPPGDYILTNGGGELLMEAEELRPAQEQATGVDLEKLDGTINIVARSGSDTLYRQTLQHAPGVPVRLRWDSTLSRFVLTEVPRPGAPRATTGGDRGGGGGSGSGGGGGGGY